MSLPQENINVNFKNNFRVNFSNIPTVGNFGDLRFLYEQMVHSITIPDYNLELIPSEFQNKISWNPISKSNDDLSDILIEFKIDAKFLNYYNMFKYMKRVRTGEPTAPDSRITPRSRFKQEQYIHNYDIEAINLSILDDRLNTVATLIFKNIFIVSLSTVGLSFAESGENTFTVNFVYRDVDIEIEDD